MNIKLKISGTYWWAIAPFCTENRKPINYNLFKGRVHCFSMSVIMSKCFLLNSEKNWRKSI